MWRSALPPLNWAAASALWLGAEGPLLEDAEGFSFGEAKGSSLLDAKGSLLKDAEDSVLGAAKGALSIDAEGAFCGSVQPTNASHSTIVSMWLGCV